MRNKRIYTEAEYDQMYPENEAVKSRYKRLKLKSLDDILGMQIQKVEDGLSSSKDSQSPITSGKLKRRDTIEKNLDEMFSSDQETELEMKEPKRKRQKHRDSVFSNENLF